MRERPGWLDDEVVQDRNWLTSRGPQDLVPFVKALLKFFEHDAPDATTERTATASSPQRDEPPAVVLSAMKWLPRPSLRTAALLGAVALVYLARRRSQRTDSMAPPLAAS
jgi:protease I